MTQRLCVLGCGRHYDTAHVCTPCRHWLPGLLTDISRYHARLGEALQRAAGTASRVSGTRTAPVPLNLDSIDLAAPARPGSYQRHIRALLDADEDATGHLPVATVLQAMVRDWRNRLYPDQHLPEPTVPTLASWLTNRLDDACDRHPAIEDAVTVLQELRATLRGQLGETPPRPEHCAGIACRKCDMRVLFKGPDWITCGNCGLLYSDTEYREWTALLAAHARTAA